MNDKTVITASIGMIALLIAAAGGGIATMVGWIQSKISGVTPSGNRAPDSQPGSGAYVVAGPGASQQPGSPGSTDTGNYGVIPSP